MPGYDWREHRSYGHDECDCDGRHEPGDRGVCLCGAPGEWVPDAYNAEMCPDEPPRYMFYCDDCDAFNAASV